VPLAEGPKLHAGFLKNNLREYGMLISLVAIMVLFQVLTDGTLLRRSTSPTCCCRTATWSSWRWACCW
jgi:ABC-type xylose transport system permease subunit